MAGATAVVCAAFDESGDAAIEAVRDRTERLGLCVRRAHRPHLTLGAARVLPGEDLDALVGVTAAVASRHPPLRIEFAKVGTFVTGVLWLGPRPAPELEMVQRDVDASLRSAGWPPAFGATTDPDQWVAHCTMAIRVPAGRLDEVRTTLRTTTQPFAAAVDALSVLLVGGDGDVARLPLSG